MTPTRINHDYLSQLYAISKEQDETELIPKLFRTLENEQEAFLRDPVTTSACSEERRNQQARVHRLKNVYFNLGCEHIGHILEEMYQALKDEAVSRERLPGLIDDYRREAPLTIGELREEIGAYLH